MRVSFLSRGKDLWQGSKQAFIALSKTADARKQQTLAFSAPTLVSLQHQDINELSRRLRISEHAKGMNLKK